MQAYETDKGKQTVMSVATEGCNASIDTHPISPSLWQPESDHDAFGPGELTRT